MSIEHVVITNLSIQDKNKEGVPYKDKRGRSFFRIGIQVDKYPDIWWSDIAYDKERDKALNLEKGKEYALSLTQSPDGQYKNFKVASRVDMLEEKVALLEEAMRMVKKILTKDADTKARGYEYPDNPHNEVPFSTSTQESVILSSSSSQNMDEINAELNTPKDEDEINPEDVPW